jgi:hypothetical protein
MSDELSQPSLGALLKSLADDLALLLRQEAQLVGAEMTSKARRAARNLLLVAAGGAIAFAGVLALLAGAIAALCSVLPLWQSALVIGFAVLVIGAAMTLVALARLRSIDPLPQQTIASLREDVAWAKEQIR